MSPARTAELKATKKIPAGKRKLILTAMRLFAERGFEGTSVRDLVDAAGVSQGLVRKHFGSKDGLRTAVDNYVIEELQRITDRSIEGIVSPGSSDMVGREIESIEASRDVMRYLQFAFFQPSAETQALFARYTNIHQEALARSANSGDLAPYVDQRWAPFLSMFIQLSGFILEPYVSELLGQPFTSRKLTRERQKAFGAMIKPWLVQADSEA